MKENRTILGWREWVSLPELGLPAIKAKVDTGAKTSALHAFDIETFKEGDVDMIRFFIHPLQNTRKVQRECVARIKDRRIVSDSGGHREMRFVIETLLVLGSRTYSVELTLTDRDTMRFRMLLGRKALEGWALVDPKVSYLKGRQDALDLYGLK